MSAYKCCYCGKALDPKWCALGHVACRACHGKKKLIDMTEQELRDACRYNRRSAMRKGRPPLPVGEARKVRVGVRLTPAERKQLKDDAWAAGMILSDYIRETALRGGAR